MTGAPARTLRHFPEGAEGPEGPFDLADPAARGGTIARLLEDGDRADLAWLASRVGADALRDWLARHGARRLSRRSRAFAAAALGVELPARRAGETAVAEALWPLA